MNNRNRLIKKYNSRVNSHSLKSKLSSSQEQEVRIDILPMIDVIFCILTFFILGIVGLSRQQSINLDLPQASSAKPQVQKMMTVNLNSSNKLYIDTKPVTHNQLFNSIKNYRELNPEGLVVLRASKKSSYNQVVQVLDILKEVGEDNVALATSFKEKEIFMNKDKSLPNTNFSNPIKNVR